MEQSRLPRSVCRITVLEHDVSGTPRPVTLYRRRKAREKSSRLLRPIETAARRWADGAASSATEYLAQHRRSNRKRRDGWIRDLNLNAVKALRKGTKRLKIYRLFGL
jgi:hypothetical protein